MRLRACTFAFAAALPLRAFAQTPPPPPPPPPATAVPAAGEMPPAEKPASPQAPAPTPPAPPAIMVMPPPPPPAAPAAPAAATPAPKFTWGGLVDTYYLFNFIRADGTNTLTGPTNRAFDTNANSFTLALAKLSMNAALDPVAFQLDLGYGSVGTIINAANGGAVPPGNVGGSFLVEQAFGTISLPGNLTLDFGKFVTTAGAEVIEANKNWLYSRSFLFNAIPLVHTGVRANLKVSDQLTLQASLVNGWNNDPDLNAWKTIGLSASVIVNPMVSAALTAYFGKEASEAMATSTPGDLRVLIDAVGAFTLNDRLGLNLNVDYIKAWDSIADDYQLGAALMGRFIVNDHLYVAARGEFLSTKATDPLLGVSHTTTVEDGTLMLGLPVGKNFELRPEVRADFSGDNVYGLDATGAPTKKDQFTGEIAALTFF